MISIIMPVKNAMPFLKECLDSILAQDYRRWELLVVDDHSTDNSYTLLSEYQTRDKRITLLKNSGKGIIDALQCAYYQMKGKWVTRMDADDIMPEWKLSKMLEALENTAPEEKIVVTGKVKYFNQNGIGEGYQRYESWLNNILIQGTAFQHIYKECVIPSPCWMTSKKHFESIGGFDSNTYPEDYDLTFRFYQHSFKIKAVDSLLHYWRDHDSRASRNDPNYSDNTFLDLKLHYFLKLDRKETIPLFLWGAGKKGKRVAKKLLQSGHPFYWLSNNPKKIGKDIYGVHLDKFDMLKQFRERAAQVLITVANPMEQEEIRTFLGPITGAQAYWFC